MHLVIRLFGSDQVTNYDSISVLAGDNLIVLIDKITDLIGDHSFKNFVAKYSEVDLTEIDLAFRDSVDGANELGKRIKSANLVYSKMVAKLPKRVYKRGLASNAVFKK